MTTLTLKTYKKALSSVVKADDKQAETIQAILVLGFEEVQKLNADGKQNNNLDVLSDLVQASGSMKNKLVKVLTAYIGDHCKHIVLSKEMRYTKVKDKTLSIEVTMPEYPYYEHSEMDKQGAVMTFNMNGRFDSFMQQRKKAVSELRGKGDNAKLIAQMKMAILALEAESKPVVESATQELSVEQIEEVA